MNGLATLRPTTGHQIPAGFPARIPPEVFSLHHLATDWENIQ